MDSLKHYRARVALETELRKSMHSLYKKFWPFILALTCSERAALTSYKATSEAINSILWLPEEVDSLRSRIAVHLADMKASVSFFRDFALDYVRTQLSTISLLENLFIHAPLLPRTTMVFRGVSKKYSASYEKLKVGDRWQPKNFLSTSFNFDTALAFSKFTGPGLVTAIVLPKRTPYLLLPGGAGADYKDAKSFEELMKGKTYIGDEMELLLNKNTIFELVKIEKIKIAPSVNFQSKDYLETQNIKLYTLRLVESQNVKFEKTAEQIVDTVETVQMRIAMS